MEIEVQNRVATKVNRSDPSRSCSGDQRDYIHISSKLQCMSVSRPKSTREKEKREVKKTKDYACATATKGGKPEMRFKKRKMGEDRKRND